MNRQVHNAVSVKNCPGGYDLKQPITAVQALAGGARSGIADLSSVILVSKDIYGRPMGRRLDLKSLFDRGDMSSAILVKPYDVIYVPGAYVCDLRAFMNGYCKAASCVGWFL